jgi:hypothetical protein
MGFFKSIHELKGQAKEIEREWDPKAQRESAMTRLAAAQQAMAEQTRAANLAATGLDATATVVDARQTSAQVNFDPIVELDLTVFPAGGPPYPATIRQVVSQLYLSKVQPGGNLVAKVDPQDPTAVWIDLARS